jgi:hypothetical protein
MLGELAEFVAPKRRSDPAAAALIELGRRTELTVVLLAYRARAHELSAKTLEFSRASIDERWAIGRADMNAALDKLEAGALTSADHGYTFYDARRASD